MSIIDIRFASSRRVPLAFRFASSAKHLLREWWVRLRSRYELESLGEEDLRDFGVSSAEACFEASKPFWKA